MKNVFLGLIALTSLSAFAQSGNFKCEAQANPALGLNKGFTVEVTPLAVNGQINLKIGGSSLAIGSVQEIVTAHKDTAEERGAFETILGSVSDKSLSGVSAGDLKKVTKITVIRGESVDEDDILVYRIFKGDKQIGGTFIGSGVGTACLSK